jgi:2-methylcitrate dehydratase PrpD
VHYRHEPRFDGLAHFPGEVTVTLRDGRVITEVEEFNRGSAQNPMTDAELREKFDDNAAAWLPASARDRLCDAIMSLETCDDASVVVAMTVR